MSYVAASRFGLQVPTRLLPPRAGLNEETRRLHAANLFAVVRQVHYSTKNEKSLDLVLFLNGIPIFTAELKNPLNAQDVENAIRQYKTDRDPREPLLAYGRCLAHLAVRSGPGLRHHAPRRAKTRFLPFNQGKFGGAGNPPRAATRKGYATAYLWEETWRATACSTWCASSSRGRGGGREGAQDRQALPYFPALPSSSTASPSS